MDAGRPAARSLAIFNGIILALTQDDDLGFTAGLDMVVLEMDSLGTDPDEIGDIEVDMTIVNGKILYNAELA